MHPLQPTKRIFNVFCATSAVTPALRQGNQMRNSAAEQSVCADDGHQYLTGGGKDEVQTGVEENVKKQKRKNLLLGGHGGWL